MSRFALALAAIIATGCNDPEDGPDMVEWSQGATTAWGLERIDCAEDTPTIVTVPHDSIWQVVYVDGESRLDGTDSVRLDADEMRVDACNFDYMEIRWIELL